ncbi:hypothetical protein FACS189415_5510 [Bacteroidia bacterium]|nr:hypothetical protein FACS189415_5510 [Bacteroidia bacterium]
MKMSKRALALLVAVAMVLMMLPVAALAGSDPGRNRETADGVATLTSAHSTVAGADYVEENISGWFNLYGEIFDYYFTEALSGNGNVAFDGDRLTYTPDAQDKGKTITFGVRVKVLDGDSNPSAAVTVSVAVTQEKDVLHALTLTNATAAVEGDSVTSGEEVEVGKTVTLTATAAPAEKVFDKWVVADASATGASVAAELENAGATAATFTMPNNADGIHVLKGVHRRAPHHLGRGVSQLHRHNCMRHLVKGHGDENGQQRAGRLAKLPTTEQLE